MGLRTKSQETSQGIILIGIYGIVCDKNKRVYIGQSVDIVTRTRKHKETLRRNSHHNYLLQRSWNKYGEKYFSFALLDLCDISELNEREEFWICYFDALNPKRGFNIIEPGMSLKGEDHYSSILTEDQVIEMLGLMHTVSNKNLASKYGVSESLISNIRCGYAWGHVMPEFDRSKFPKLRKISDKDIEEIKLLLRDTYMDMKAIADLYGISWVTVKHIRSGKYRNDIRPDIKFSGKNTSYRNVLFDTPSKVKTELENKISVQEIAQKYKLSISCVRKFRLEFIEERNRKVIQFLNSGNTNIQAAEEFGLHASSISIIKRKAARKQREGNDDTVCN